MRLLQNKTTGYWTKFESGDTLANTHNPKLCEGRGCAIHNHPSNHSLHEAPMHWDPNVNVLERMCSHRILHPDSDSAAYVASIGQDYLNLHTCDGCCSDVGPLIEVN